MKYVLCCINILDGTICLLSLMFYTSDIHMICRHFMLLHGGFSLKCGQLVFLMSQGKHRN